VSRLDREIYAWQFNLASARSYGNWTEIEAAAAMLDRLYRARRMIAHRAQVPK
jgi:hypothetical protein